MKALLTSIVSFGADERGATAIEYGLIAAMVAVGCIVAIGFLGASVGGLFGSTNDGAGGAIRAAADSMN